MSSRIKEIIKLIKSFGFSFWRASYARVSEGRLLNPEGLTTAGSLVFQFKRYVFHFQACFLEKVK